MFLKKFSLYGLVLLGVSAVTATVVLAVENVQTKDCGRYAEDSFEFQMCMRMRAVPVYTTSEVDARISSANQTVIQSLNQNINSQIAQVNASVNANRDALNKRFDALESSVLKTVNSLDQRILNDEVLKKFREDIKAEIRVQIQKAMDAERSSK